MRRLTTITRVYKVSDFISWQQSGSLVLSPSFQRRPVWNASAKSFLLDSVLKGLPTSIIFIRERRELAALELKREVVDGQQRLRTVIGYVTPSLLHDYDPSRDAFEIQKVHNPDLAGKPFSELDPEAQSWILDYEFPVTLLPADTEDHEVLQIFARINSTGLGLKHQEIRNAEFVGLFKNAMYDMAYEQLDRWRRWGVFSESQIARMDEVEMTSELAQLMMFGLVRKHQSTITALYRTHENDFMEEKEVRHRFRFIMDQVDKVIGDVIPELVYSGKIQFYTLFSIIYNLSYGIETELTRTKAIRLPGNLRAALINASDAIRSGDIPEELIKYLRGASGDQRARQVRLEFIHTFVDAT